MKYTNFFQVIFLISLLSSKSTAQSKISEPLEIYSRDSYQEPVKKNNLEEITQKPVKKEKKTSKVKEQVCKSNLPNDYQSKLSTQSELKSMVILPTETKQEKLLSVRTGDIADIEITHSIIAFPDEFAPVVAIIKTGQLKQAKLFGQSRLEKNSKRIFIDFSRISFNQSTYEIQAKLISNTEGPGLQGEYHSNEGLYFAGDFVSTFTAAYFDSQVPRSTNAFGQVVEENSIDVATKKAFSAGAMSTAERFKEKLKRVPEFSELKNPITAKVVFIELGQRL